MAAAVEEVKLAAVALQLVNVKTAGLVTHVERKGHALAMVE
jgi:hypothetical protein